MKKRVAKILILVLSVNMLFFKEINSDISTVKATNEEKTYVALTQNKNLEKEISKVDDEDVEKANID